MNLVALMSLSLLTATEVYGAGSSWQSLYQAYAGHFLDRQIRVIDRDAAGRTTSEAQAYAMFFALVANDRPRFDALLGWTEKNLASGDLATHLPAWLWGRSRSNRWGVLDANSASDADVWMAYSLLEAGQAWNEPRYTSLGRALASLIVREEVVEIPGIGAVLMPAPRGFRYGGGHRLNVSYMPLQLFRGLDRLLPGGPWQTMADRIPALVKASSPQGFASDWLDFSPSKGFTPSEIGSYDSIRVYLWAGMLDQSTPGRDAIVSVLSGMTTWLRSHPAPPEKVKRDGTVTSPNGPVGFSAAVLPYLVAIGEKPLESTQLSRMESALDAKTGLYGRPARYYDQNLTLFALGWTERRFWFDSSGALKFWWRDAIER
jgi:endo-1,4-beta-D-glucanase Y